MTCAPLTGPRTHGTHTSRPADPRTRTISFEEASAQRRAAPPSGRPPHTTGRTYRGRLMFISFCSLATVILGQTFYFCSPG